MTTKKSKATKSKATSKTTKSKATKSADRPRMFLFTAKNRNRPTLAELWEALESTRRERDAAKERYAGTMDAKIERLAETLERVGENVSDIERDMVRGH